MRCAHAASFLLSTLCFSAISQAITFDCDRVKVSGVEWDLRKLKGPRTVHDLPYDTLTGSYNTTFKIDLCEALRKDDDSKNDCPTGTRVCAYKTRHEKGTDKEPELEEVWPVAGELLHNGGYLDPVPERLKSSKSHSDSGKEGLRIEFKGGKRPDSKQDQKAIIELICDKERSGREGPSGKEDKKEDKRKRADDDNSDDGDEDDKKPSPDGNQSLQFVSYEDEPQSDGASMGVLRLVWNSKYACEDQMNEKEPDDEDNSKKNNSWGFFKWFIVILFLAIASYLIFGSWLNYNKYGARGWDLLPHGDTIRDLPYLVKDWGRKVVSTVQGNSGSGRGGYSAL